MPVIAPAGRRARVLMAAALLLVSCGYRVVRGDAPFGARRIAVVPFAEVTPAGLSGELGDELTELLAAGGVRVTLDEDAAEAVLSGTVLSASTSLRPINRAGADIPGYQVNVVVEARLMRPDGTVLWRTRVSQTESFLPDNDREETSILETEANRRRALHRTAAELARAIHERMLLASSASPGE